MILVLKLDQDIGNIKKMKQSNSCSQNKHTDTQTDMTKIITYTLTRKVTNCNFRTNDVTIER